MTAWVGRSGRVRYDLAWKYCTHMEGNKNDTKCNYYSLIIKSGGITQFKYHLSHIGQNSNTKKCLRIPLRVKQEF